MRMPIVCIGYSNACMKCIHQMINSKIWCVEDFYFSKLYDTRLLSSFDVYNSYDPSSLNTLRYLVAPMRTLFFMESVNPDDILVRTISPLLHRHADIFFSSHQSLEEVQSFFPNHRVVKLLPSSLHLQFSARWTDSRKRTVQEMFYFLEE